jgi:hypothetical protein
MSDLDPQELLGKREDGHLEFKDAEVVRRPVKVAREVVGFLNADGGEVWIGVKEGEQGRAVELQVLEKPDVARRALLDHLVGVIEPPFSQDEVAVRCVDGLIQVAVKKGAHRPYAVRDGGRHFLTRVDDRLNEMTREQIRDAFAAAGSVPDQELSALKAKLRKDLEETALARKALWLRLVPAANLTIDLADPATKQLLRDWLTDPLATGNRRGGWTFATDLRMPRFKGDFVQHGEDTDFIKTTINEHGEVTFVVELSALANLKYTPQQLLAPQEFAPYALLEYPASVFRLMGKILVQFGKDLTGATVLGALSIKGIRGWALTPGSPRVPTRWPGSKTIEQDPLQFGPDRLGFDAQLLARHPDRCTLRLVRLIYGEVGFEDDAIPSEFDQKQGVLSMP